MDKQSKKSLIVARKLRRNLLLISIIAFVLKVFIIFRIQGFDWYQSGDGDVVKGLGELLDNNYAPPNAWYGADGENYIRGLQSLAKDGFFSDEEKLSYWPAGYPLLLWPLLNLFQGYFFMALAIVQSLAYTLGSIWFLEEISKTRLKKVTYLLALFLAFNPTLSLNTISVGYEMPVVALSLISIAALTRYFNKGSRSVISGEALIASISFGLATFMQPRLIIIAGLFFLLWAIAKYRLMLFAPFLVLTLGLVAIAPAVMIFRNNEVHGYAAISTNLGVTMRLGAGPDASGGYSNNPNGLVECPEVAGDAAQIDNAKVRCVLTWYVDNPGKAIKLFFNKAKFFLSPWFGPEANGTMARNPWSQNHPLLSSAQTQEGFNLVFGFFGKFVSWIWMLGGLVLLVYGTLFMWRMGGLERFLSLVFTSSFLLNMFSSMLTIGDHRFRIPTMAMSTFLQVVGIIALTSRKSWLGGNTSSNIEWPTLTRFRKGI